MKFWDLTPGLSSGRQKMAPVSQYRPSLQNGLDTLIVTLYTLSIYPFVHKQLIRTILEGRQRPVYVYWDGRGRYMYTGTAAAGICILVRPRPIYVYWDGCVRYMYTGFKKFKNELNMEELTDFDIFNNYLPTLKVQLQSFRLYFPLVLKECIFVFLSILNL